MLFECITDTAIVPKRGSSKAAGYDFHADETKVVPARGKALVGTGIRTNFEPDVVLFLKSRSGLSVKNGVYTEAGVIDSDYEGEIKVALSNNSDTDYVVMQGDKISQGVFLQLPMKYYPDVEESLPERGEGGFGSTGK